ncbi:MAG: hypothetical protein FWB85_10170 [Chitinispirillia bacterium]|nr:hypothetical protein [Chitinispirillia bacterium]MCL2242568.1 hypothetical protein [Chitinispirillia bacterium]
MPDYIEYRKSISEELMAIRNQVRYFTKHWLEDGRHKEIILRNTLIKHLPKTVSVGTGFVIGDNEKTSRQIDIIVYLNSYPPVFSMEDFVIVVKESVVGIIEVKSTIEKGKFKGVIQKAHENGKLIGKDIFNGIFAYEADIRGKEDSLSDSIRKPLTTHNGFVNNIAFGEDVFAKLWSASEPRIHNRNTPPANVPHYSFYNLGGNDHERKLNLAFGYFISNLIVHVHTRCEKSVIPETLKNALYPLNTKEEYHIQSYEIDIR